MGHDGSTLDLLTWVVMFTEKIGVQFSEPEFNKRFPELPDRINKEVEGDFWDAVCDNLQSSFKTFTTMHPISDLELDESTRKEILGKSPEVMGWLQRNREAAPLTVENGREDVKYLFPRFPKETGANFVSPQVWTSICFVLRSRHNSTNGMPSSEDGADNFDKCC